MILIHVRTCNDFRTNLHSKINLKNNTICILYNNQTHEFNLPVSLIRKKYGSGLLKVIIQKLKNDEQFTVSIFKNTDFVTTECYINSDANAIFAEIPEGANSWLDSGVKVITREVNKEVVLDRPTTDVQIFFNNVENFNPDNQEDINSILRYSLSGSNPFKKGYLFMSPVKVYAKEI